MRTQANAWRSCTPRPRHPRRLQRDSLLTAVSTEGRASPGDGAFIGHGRLIDPLVRQFGFQQIDSPLCPRNSLCANICATANKNLQISSMLSPVLDQFFAHVARNFFRRVRDFLKQSSNNHRTRRRSYSLMGVLNNRQLPAFAVTVTLNI